MKYLSIVALAAFFAHGAMAETVTYNCKMTKQDSHGWIARSYAIQVDAEDGWAKVASRPEWIDTKYKSRGNKGVRMVWTETRRASAGGNLRVKYQANLNPADNSLKVRMSFVSTNAANKPYGLGTCSVES
ncbi:hypothetical protein [Ruegeria arenilitoris]|uniref:hypothetical protein n=1 Tax=Ruegeria arenilitoris TaxID=1173585 RepID=UPI0014814261|nr:hypothetical protein [Ruegeria arenilitoris]